MMSSLSLWLGASRRSLFVLINRHTFYKTEGTTLQNIEGCHTIRLAILLGTYINHFLSRYFLLATRQ